MARRDRRTADPRFEEEPGGGGLALDTAHALPPTGPHDGDALDPDITDAAGLVDFGSIRVPVPPEGTVTVEPTAGGRMQAVHVALPEGRLSVSALAAPKTSKLWPELAGEIAASLRESGARVRSFGGEWGRELHATSGGATSVFVGVDGARWMLYGVATGPSTSAEPLDAELRRMLRGTVVMRGKQPFPVRTILPLTVPDHIAAEAEAAAAVTASKKRSASKQGTAKQGAAKQGAAKSAPGKTAPANPDAATAAAKKAARRAAARKAAAAAAVKAAAEALAEQVAEDRAAAAAQERDTRPSHTSGTGPHSIPGTIPTGPGPDAPLREQAPSARRAAASAWRSRPAAAGWEAPPPTEAIPVAPPVAPPVEEQPVTEAIPVAPAADLPPTEALRRVEPGSGGRRRLREAGPAADLPPGGRRHLQEPQAEDSFPGRRPRGPEAPLGAAASWDPYEAERPRQRYEPPPAAAPGRRQPEPTAGRPPWATGPDELDATGARRSHDPHSAVAADSPVSASGRRRLRESWDGAEPVAPVADSGVSASGRRRLRESWDGPGSDATGVLRPGEPPAAAPAVSAPGRRRVEEPWGGSDPVAPAGGSGVSASGRRRVEEPWGGSDPVAPAGGSGVSGPGRRRSQEPWAPAADSGVSSTGRRRLREPWDGVAPVADSEVSASGRRRLQESGDRSGPDGDAAARPGVPPAPAGGERWEAGPGAGVSETGRRRLRDPWEDTAVPLHGTGPHAAVSATGRRHLAQPRGPAFDSGVSSTGRRRLRESWEDAGPRPTDLDAGVSASGRRRLREPEDDALLSAGPPPWEDRPGPGADLLSGTGGRRLRGEPDRRGEPERPPGYGPAGPDAPVGRRAARRHAEEGDGSPTVRLDALLAELDPNRPRRRHRRAQ